MAEDKVRALDEHDCGCGTWDAEAGACDCQTCPAVEPCGDWEYIDDTCQISCGSCPTPLGECGHYELDLMSGSCYLDCTDCPDSVCGGLWEHDGLTPSLSCHVPVSTCTIDPSPCGQWVEGFGDVDLDCSSCPAREGSCIQWYRNGEATCGPFCDACPEPSCGTFLPDWSIGVADHCSVYDCSECGDAGCGTWVTACPEGPDCICQASCYGCDTGPCGEPPKGGGTDPCSVNCDDKLLKIRATMSSDGYANDCDDWSCGTGRVWKDCDEGCVNTCHKPQVERLCLATGGEYQADNCSCDCPALTHWIAGIGCSEHPCPLVCRDGSKPEGCDLENCNDPDPCGSTCPPGHSHDADCKCTCMNSCAEGQNQGPDCLCYDPCPDQEAASGCRESGGAWDAYRCLCDCSQAGNKTQWSPVDKACTCPDKHACNAPGSWDDDACSCDCSSVRCGTGSLPDPYDCHCECSDGAVLSALCSATKGDDGDGWNQDSCDCDCGSSKKWEGTGGCVCKTEQELCAAAGGTWSGGTCSCPQSGYSWECTAEAGMCLSCECREQPAPCDPDGTRRSTCEASHGRWVDSDPRNCHCQCDDPYESDPDSGDSCRCKESLAETCANRPGHELDEACNCICASTPEKEGCVAERNREWDEDTCTCGCLQSAKAACDVDDPGSDWEWNDYPDCSCDCPHVVRDPCRIHRDDDGWWKTDTCTCECKDEDKNACELVSWGRGGTWNSYTCSCECSESGKSECLADPSIHEYDDDSCSCSCIGVSPSAVAQCEARTEHSFWDTETCSCKCDNGDPLCGASSDVYHYWDDTTCSCKCVDVGQDEIDACTECSDSNPSCGSWDADGNPCACSCPDKKTLSGESCVCTDNDALSNLCDATRSDDGTGWDPKTCTCGCGTVLHDGLPLQRGWSDGEGCTCPAELNDREKCDCEGKVWCAGAGTSGKCVDSEDACCKAQNSSWVWCQCKNGGSGGCSVSDRACCKDCGMDGREGYYCPETGHCVEDAEACCKDQGSDFSWCGGQCYQAGTEGHCTHCSDGPACWDGSCHVKSSDEYGYCTCTAGDDPVAKCKCDGACSADRATGSCLWSSDNCTNRVPNDSRYSDDCDCICKKQSLWCEPTGCAGQGECNGTFDSSCYCLCDSFGAKCDYKEADDGKLDEDCNCICKDANAVCGDLKKGIPYGYGRNNDACECECRVGEACTDTSGKAGKTYLNHGLCDCRCDREAGKSECAARGDKWKWVDNACDCRCKRAGETCTTPDGEKGFIDGTTCKCETKCVLDCTGNTVLNKNTCECECSAEIMAQPCEYGSRDPERDCQCGCTMADMHECNSRPAVNGKGFIWDAGTCTCTYAGAGDCCGTDCLHGDGEGCRYDSDGRCTAYAVGCEYPYTADDNCGCARCVDDACTAANTSRKLSSGCECSCDLTSADDCPEGKHPVADVGGGCACKCKEIYGCKNGGKWNDDTCACDCPEVFPDSYSADGAWVWLNDCSIQCGITEAECVAVNMTLDSSTCTCECAECEDPAKPNSKGKEGGCECYCDKDKNGYSSCPDSWDPDNCKCKGPCTSEECGDKPDGYGDGDCLVCERVSGECTWVENEKSKWYAPHAAAVISARALVNDLEATYRLYGGQVLVPYDITGNNCYDYYSDKAERRACLQQCSKDTESSLGKLETAAQSYFAASSAASATVAAAKSCLSALESAKCGSSYQACTGDLKDLVSACNGYLQAYNGVMSVYARCR